MGAITGFASMCETAQPDHLVRLTTEYFQAMCREIASTGGGVLDKVRW